MNRVSVSSSDLKNVGYDKEKQILEIEFHSGGVCQYFNVSERVYQALMDASSHGTYFHRDINGSGAAGCWTLDNRAPDMIRGNFDPGFFAEYQYKDLRIATNAGEAFGSPMPQTELAHELYKSMVQNDMGRDDNSGVIQVIEMLTGDEARVED